MVTNRKRSNLAFPFWKVARLAVTDEEIPYRKVVGIKIKNLLFLKGLERAFIKINYVQNL